MTTASSSGGPAPISLFPSAQSWLVPGERPKTILDNLLERTDATRLVRATPIQPLYLFIKSLGLGDAHELIAMCLPEQIQGFLDLDVWDKDQLVPSRLSAWLAHLIELPPSRLVTHLRKLDAELLTTFLAPHITVYDLSEEDAPDEAQGMFYATPDRFFLIDILPASDGDSDRAVLIHRLLEHIYKGDLDLARAIINAARWDAGAATEENAYQFRSGRMADMGFIDFYEALALYQEVDPRTPVPKKHSVVEHKHPGAIEPSEVRSTGPGGFLGTASGLWGTLMPELQTPSSLLRKVSDELPDSEREAFLHELLFLANQAMSADRIALDDLTQTELTLQRAAGYVLLGLAHRSGVGSSGDSGSDEKLRAVETLRSVPLTYLFRLGYSLTLAVRKLAKLLVDSGATTLIPGQSAVSLLPSDEAAMLSALLALRPLYPRALDGVQSAPSLRPFSTLRDLSKAASFVEQLAIRPKLFALGLGLRLETLRATLERTTPDASQATWDDVLGTMIGNHLLGRPPALVPLSRQDLVPLRALLAGHDQPTLPELVRARCLKLIDDRIDERITDEHEAKSLQHPAQRAFIDRVLGQLATSLHSLPDPLDPAEADLIARLPGLIIA
ncbi:MAG: hypothetical protein JNM40_10945 [Myxococcales bacterium]|nr:hypothetical protein [Myxococcales bacterium]